MCIFHLIHTHNFFCSNSALWLLVPCPCSDEHAGTEEDASKRSDADTVRGFLHLRQEVLLVSLGIGSTLSIGHEREGTLGQVVELVGPAVSGSVFHGIMHPEGVLGTISILIVVNGPEAVSQQLSVHARVERILRHVEDVESRQDAAARELLLGEVL